MTSGELTLRKAKELLAVALEARADSLGCATTDCPEWDAAWNRRREVELLLDARPDLLRQLAEVLRA